MNTMRAPAGTNKDDTGHVPTSLLRLEPCWTIEAVAMRFTADTIRDPGLSEKRPVPSVTRTDGIPAPESGEESLAYDVAIRDAGVQHKS